jgi:tetratricopeptide (TPR) repeat protein
MRVFLASLRTLYKYLFLAGLILILSECSVEKNTASTRFYHSLTARFNIFFNGNESFKSGVAKITNSHRDDYASILNVFEYSDPSTVSAGSGDMERAIQKASKLISLKSITAKPEINNKREISEKDKNLLDRKEYNDWVDDSYLLIGKARFYKHEFAEAESLFNYCMAEANDPLLKAEAAIWLARTHNETKNYSESFRVLNELQITDEFSDALRSMYYTTMADLFIKQKRYQEAIDPLSNALGLVSGKRTRYRLTYLLAQLFEQTGDGTKAQSLYMKVIKMNPPYEVEFNTRINIAGVFDVKSGNSEEIRKELEKMLRDPKNKEFSDQIYYALGNMSMKEGNEAEAIGFYRKSASSRSSNPNQKGRSYLALANYYYEKPDYLKAGTFLDSTVYFLDQRSPDFPAIQARSRNLNELVSQLVIIEREDSLQRIAMLPEAQRNEIISGIIAKVTKDESEGKTSDYADRYNIGQYYENERRFQGNIEQEGKWYFYNQAAMTFGRTEFRRRWGDRKLEDNWRRSNKTRSNSAQPGTSPGDMQNAQKDTSKTLIDNKNPKFYLRNLPLTDSLMTQSGDRLSTAMLNAGKAFSERIADTVKATEMLESLLTKYPSSPLIPEALYTLYRINTRKNSTKAETYRQKLIEKYGDSEFAFILSDPAYYEKKIGEIKAAEKSYVQAYDEYTAENFQNALKLINEAMEKYPKNSLAPKFMLLHAYTLARTTDERTFKDDLRKLSETWPGTPESKKAGELISYLNQKMPELKVEEDKQIAAELYVVDTLSARKFALVINDPSFNLNQATFDVISYNIDNYTNMNYRTEGTLVDNKFILITVSGFSNYSQAFRYFKSFDKQKLVRNISGARMISIVISDENLKKLIEDKNPERYDAFFRERFR